MTKALEEAFREASTLPDEEQDELAAAIHSEIASDADWQRSLAGSLDVLERLADEALDEHRRGRTRPIRSTDD